MGSPAASLHAPEPQALPVPALQGPWSRIRSISPAPLPPRPLFPPPSEGPLVPPAAEHLQTVPSPCRRGVISGCAGNVVPTHTHGQECSTERSAQRSCSPEQSLVQFPVLMKHDIWKAGDRQRE